MAKLVFKRLCTILMVLSNFPSPSREKELTLNRYDHRISCSQRIYRDQTQWWRTIYKDIVKMLTDGIQVLFQDLFTFGDRKQFNFCSHQVNVWRDQFEPFNFSWIMVFQQVLYQSGIHKVYHRFRHWDQTKSGSRIRLLDLHLPIKHSFSITASEAARLMAVLFFLLLLSDLQWRLLLPMSLADMISIWQIYYKYHKYSYFWIFNSMPAIMSSTPWMIILNPIAGGEKLPLCGPVFLIFS